MIDKYLKPLKIITSCNVEGEENILEERPLQASFKNDGCTIIKKGGFLLLDFGKEICGGIVLVIDWTSRGVEASKCRVVFGESVMEAMSEIGFKDSLNVHAIKDTVLEVPSKGFVRYGNTGFRFLKLEAIDTDIPIRTIKAELDIKDIEYKGSFLSNDERLNEIWKTGAYTVHLNMHEFIWDGIKRDRLVWMGDTHPEMSVIKAVFGYDDSIPNSLDFVKSEFSPNEWINRLPSYSMWWIIIHYDWYMQNGDLEYLMNQVDYIEKLIPNVMEWVDKADKNEEEIFVDWSSNSDKENALIGVYAVIYKALCVSEKIFELAENKKMTEFCQKSQTKLEEKKIKLPNQKQVAALCAYSGLFEAKEVNAEVLSKEPLSGLSTFIGYYVLMARAQAGDVAGALDTVRKYWGAMLDFGATSFWEDFDLKWTENAVGIDEIVPEGKADIHGDFGQFCYTRFRHSLCHGWAGGPTAFLSQYILGVNIAEAGCRKIVIKPNLCDLEWVKGTYPTPYGIIEIEHKMINGEIVTEVKAPKEVEVTVLK